PTTIRFPPVAAVRERRTGVWEIRVFTGRDDDGRPTQISKTVRGTKRDAKRVAAQLAGSAVESTDDATTGARLHLGEGRLQFVSRIDVQFLEHLAQVVVDGMGTDEELGGDVAVLHSLSGERCYL